MSPSTLFQLIRVIESSSSQSSAKWSDNEFHFKYGRLLKKSHLLNYQWLNVTHEMKGSFLITTHDFNVYLLCRCFICSNCLRKQNKKKNNNGNGSYLRSMTSPRILEVKYIEFKREHVFPFIKLAKLGKAV